MYDDVDNNNQQQRTAAAGTDSRQRATASAADKQTADNLENETTLKRTCCGVVALLVPTLVQSSGSKVALSPFLSSSSSSSQSSSDSVTPLPLPPMLS